MMLKENNFPIRFTFTIIIVVSSPWESAGNDQKKRKRKTHTPGLQIATNEFSYMFFTTSSTYTSGLHFMATNIKSFHENWIRVPFFIYLFFFVSSTFTRISHTYSCTFYVFHTLNNIREIRCFSPYFHSLTVTSPCIPCMLCTVYRQGAL